MPKYTYRDPHLRRANLCWCVLAGTRKHAHQPYACPAAHSTMGGTTGAIDHTQELRYHGRPVLLSEPYFVHEDKLADIVERYGVTYAVGADGTGPYARLEGQGVVPIAFAQNLADAGALLALAMAPGMIEPARYGG